MAAEVHSEGIGLKPPRQFVKAPQLERAMITCLFGRIQDAIFCNIQQNLADRSGSCPACVYYRVRYVGMRKVVLSRVFFGRACHGDYRLSRNV